MYLYVIYRLLVLLVIVAAVVDLVPQPGPALALAVAVAPQTDGVVNLLQCRVISLPAEQGRRQGWNRRSLIN